MGTIIPLRPVSATSVPAEQTGVLVPLRPGGAVAGSAAQRDQQVLRAVAAAVAVSHTAESLTESKAAQRENADPGALFAAINKADLAVVVDEVRRVQANRTGAAGPDEEQRLVAAAVGADAVLVAAAHAKVKDSANVSQAARAWVAATDPALFAKAASAAAQREVLNPSSTDDFKKLGDRLDVEIAKANAEIAKSNAEIANVKADIAGIKTDVGTVKTDIAGIKTDVGNLTTGINTKIDDAVAKLTEKLDAMTYLLPKPGELDEIRKRLEDLEGSKRSKS